MPDNSEINEQFKSSMEAIEKLQTTILELSNLQSSQEQSSQSLITASEKLNELTDSLKSATPEIQETLVSVGESLDTAQQFLAQTDSSSRCFLPHQARWGYATAMAPSIGGKDKGLFCIDADPDTRSLTKGIQSRNPGMQVQLIRSGGNRQVNQ